MTGLPELPAATNCLLNRLQDAVLEENGLAGAHLQWHREERDRLNGIRSPMPIEVQLLAWDEREVDAIGIPQSVVAAKALFVVFSERYRLSLDEEHDALADRLGEIKERVSETIASVWKGKSTEIDRWYERAGGPAVDKTLAVLVEPAETGPQPEVRAPARKHWAQPAATKRPPAPPAPKPPVETVPPADPPRPAAPPPTEPGSQPKLDAGLEPGRRAERKAARDAYVEECKKAGVRVTDEMIAKAANPNTDTHKGWNTRDPIQKWLRLDPHYEGAPDHRIRKVFRDKPHLKDPNP